MIDVLVVGGGPVGLVTALHADAAGLHVEVVDPRRTPIDKACGEGLMAAAVAALSRLGVHPDGMPLHGIRYVSGSRRAEAAFPGAPGLGVRRLELQQSLSTAVAERGIPVRQQRAQRIAEHEDHIAVDGTAARFLVGADGLHSSVRRSTGLDRPTHASARYGQRRHYRRAPWTDLIEVHWNPVAEAYITPVGPEEIVVAVLTSRRGTWADQLAGFPAVRELIGDAEPTSTVRGAGPFRQRARTVARGRIALVGDAAGYIDALTGEGLSAGFAAADALVECLRADRLGDYPAAHRRATWQSQALTHGVLAMSKVPVLRRSIVPLACAIPPLYRGAVGLLGG